LQLLPKSHEGGQSTIASRKAIRDKKAQASWVDASYFEALHIYHIQVHLLPFFFLAKFSQIYFQNG
jgi:hypothetical protein